LVYVLPPIAKVEVPVETFVAFLRGGAERHASQFGGCVIG